jgi:serine/threonine protein kinase
MLDMADMDLDASVSMTWSIDPNGTMRHKQTGTRVSPNDGITFEGQEYRLSCEDIELEGGDKTLGAGAGGVVIKGVIKKTGVPVAVKTIKVDDKAKREQLLNELKGLVQSAGCPQLVQWYAGFVNKNTSAVHVALEFMDLGSLHDLQKRLRGSGVPPHYLACIARQVMLGLAHLHGKHLLHRDLKPHNILHNTKGEVKLTDFGIAKDLDCSDAMAGTFVGTVTYMSPERCLGNDYNLASDVWSVGMVFFELAAGRYPFSDVQSFPALFDNLCEKPEPRLDEGLYPPALCDFVAQCLTRDVAKRMETNLLLQHPFVNEGVPTEADLAAWFATLV